MNLEQSVYKKSNKYTVYLNRDIVGTPIESAVLNGFDSLQKAYSLEKIPSSRFSDVYKISDNGSVFYFKQYRYRSVWDFVKHIFRPSRAQRSLQAAEMLKTNGFSSPEIIAMGFQNRIFKSQNFVLMREIENALSVENFFKRNFEKGCNRVLEKRKLIQNFGYFIGHLHSKNISHGDLRLSNVLATKNGSDTEFFLLDNERTIKHWGLPFRLRFKNLVQVNMFQPLGISRTDRLRFLKSYLDENPKLVPKWKKLAIRVQKKTFKRLSSKNRSFTVG